MAGAVDDSTINIVVVILLLLLLTPLDFVGLRGMHTATFMPQEPTARKSRCIDAYTIFALVTSVTSLENSVDNSLKHRIKVL